MAPVALTVVPAMLLAATRVDLMDGGTAVLVGVAAATQPHYLPAIASMPGGAG
jgi:hypothetical protein